MKTLICPTCGCSLVRLGITKEKAILNRYCEEDYYFCCQGCANLFVTDPDKYLEETSDLIVCPSCLAEKPPDQVATIEIEGQELHFCRCPYCAEVVKKNLDFYINRLAGNIPNEGAVLDHEGCCIRPEQ